MAAVKIEKGVEVPRNERGSKFPLNEMEVGDSFLVPTNTLHGAVALSEGVLIDVFTPLREDFLN